ncbi:MAG TPA: GT4 family glycosyltransferase PelF [Myxococcales bacterium]|nr:GT4 family glycosyltransferase PelF [Myxococcales bacterium]
MKATDGGAPVRPADVGLLLEGTYPFVRGGVSAWVHKLIEALPEITFSLVFIGGRRSEHAAAAYKFPPNVVHFERHDLFEPQDGRPRRGGSATAIGDLDLLHEQLLVTSSQSRTDTRVVKEIALGLGKPDGLSPDALLDGDACWEWMCDRYRRDRPDGSFTSYFWTLRATYLGVLTLAQVARRLPAARSYHSLSTGYAGFLGALLRHQRGRPLILTEHGIYTKERMIDLASAESFPGGDVGRHRWMGFFHGLGRMAYASAQPIIALYEGNRRRQIDDGAEPARTRIIPNGVDVERFRSLRAKAPERPHPVIGFIGRVVPIKDVKTFIRAMKAVVAERPEVEGWIVGPTSEDEGYAAECRQLVSSLGLETSVKFLGFRPPEEILPRLGLLALTSMSEALPLVVLEAFASGIPVLTTDVGACRELVEGRTAEDRALGAAGAVVPIADPEKTARAALALLEDPARWRKAQRAAVRRVEAHYTQDQMIDAYRQVYREASTWPA